MSRGEHLAFYEELKSYLAEEMGSAPDLDAVDGMFVNLGIVKMNVRRRSKTAKARRRRRKAWAARWNLRLGTSRGALGGF